MTIDIDDHKLMYHPERVSEWKETGDCYPIYVEIGLTNTCNHRCNFCALDFMKDKGTYIDKNIMNNTLKNMGEHGVKSVMFAGEGESTLHKNIADFVKTAKSNNMDTAITTNGVPFTKNKMEQTLPYLSWIRFSVDEDNANIYSKVHGNKKQDFYKVINNISDVVSFRNKEKLKTNIGIQMVVIPDNINSVEQLAETCRNIGVDNLQLKPYSFHPQSNNNFNISINDYMKLESMTSRVNSNTFEILHRKNTLKNVLNDKDYNECYGLPFFALIDSKGSVLSCNLYHDKFTYGNLYDNTFSDIWESQQRKDSIKSIKQIGIKDCRKGCRLDNCNKYLHRLKNKNEGDNFI